MKNKYKIGILGCGYNCHEGLDKRLNPWFGRPDYKDFIFSFVSCKFKEYEELGIYSDNSETEKALGFLLKNELIQYLEVPDKPLDEATARNLALRHLLDDGCDYIILLDLSDEYYTEEQIHNILYYLNKEDNQFCGWFSILFKNYIFDGKQWIGGFCPPRIFKVNYDETTTLEDFYWDNDVRYKDNTNNSHIDYKQLPSNVIPSNLLGGGVRHMTWLHTNGEFKEKYQRAHFNGICSYKFDKEKNELSFDNDYYKDKPYPIINKDE